MGAFSVAGMDTLGAAPDGVMGAAVHTETDSWPLQQHLALQAQRGSPLMESPQTPHFQRPCFRWGPWLYTL